MSKTSKVLTGSTGNAKVDLTPRQAWIAMWTGAAFLACLIFDPGTEITGAAVALAGNAAFLSTVAFDGFIRPRL